MKSLDGFIKKTFFMDIYFFFFFNFLSIFQEETEKKKKHWVCSQDALTRSHKQTDFPDWDFHVCLMADSLHSILRPLRQPCFAQWEKDAKGLVQLLGITGTNSQTPAQCREACLGVKEWSTA